MLYPSFKTEQKKREEINQKKNKFNILKTPLKATQVKEQFYIKKKNPKLNVTKIAKQLEYNKFPA